ncbi:hypothetical protein ACFQXA_06025 [Nocardiopsis composta]
MRIKKALGSLTVAVALTAGTFGAMGAAAPPPRRAWSVPPASTARP